MKRRAFITLLGSAAASPLAGRAQRPDKVRRIGVLMPLAADDPVGQARIAALREGLEKLGWIDGRNIRIDTRWTRTMAGKWLELLKEIAPHATRVTFLFNPATATYFEYWLNPFKAAAISFAVEAIAAPVRDRSELESVIAEQARAPNGGLVVMPDTFTDAHRVEITSLAARYRLPAVYPYRQFTAVGGLRHERSLWQRIPGRGGRGARAGADAGAGAEFGRTVCFRCPDPFRSRRFQARGALGPRRFRERALEPEDEGRGRVVARPV